jgi:hypothetical protein
LCGELNFEEAVTLSQDRIRNIYIYAIYANTMLLFYILQNNYPNISCMFFEHLLLKGAQRFQKSESHFKILGARTVTD